MSEHLPNINYLEPEMLQKLDDLELIAREAVEGLKKEHIIRMTLIIDSERPQEMFARLNLRHGPNTEQIVRELDLSTRELYVEFDLFYTNFKEARAQSLWIDLIFESPSMNQITIRDISVIRRRRANT